ncbi:hypothetical protein HWI79_3242 [Cryptosporidium felis]|nr:hypothetical protein HWI79_3242 [Cryptosporidium felis]
MPLADSIIPKGRGSLESSKRFGSVESLSEHSRAQGYLQIRCPHKKKQGIKPGVSVGSLGKSQLLVLFIVHSFLGGDWRTGGGFIVSKALWICFDLGGLGLRTGFTGVLAAASAFGVGNPSSKRLEYSEAREIAS